MGVPPRQSDVEDRSGLIGGIFRTRKAAFRFAMFEADWNRSCIHFRRCRTASGRADSRGKQDSQAASPSSSEIDNGRR